MTIDDRNDFILEMAEEMYERERAKHPKAYPLWRHAPDELVSKFFDKATRYCNGETTP